jgi:hypothetical protein
MKKLFYIKIALFSVMATALFSSCLKDAAREYNFQNSSPVVDFALAAYNLKATATATISLAAGKNNVNFLVTVQSPQPTTSAVTVNAILDASTIGAGGTVAPTYTLLPASTYTITSPGLTITIPPGTSAPVVGSASVPIVGALPATFAQGQGVIQFVVDAVAVKALQTANPTTTYAIPLTITSASGQGVIVDQFHTLVYKIVVGA